MVRRMGIVKVLDNSIINVDVLESGNKIIWCDHTINDIIKRISVEVSNE